MIGKFPKVGPRVYGGFDADAQAFITAAGITDATQQQAINTLVVDMKGYGIWTKMKAIYPFVGGTATTHKYNLKDPRDLDAAFRLSFNGGWTHSSNGALPNGSNAYADTYFSQLNGFDSVSSASIGAYIRTDSSSNSGDMGAGGTNTASSGMLIYSSFGGSTYYGCALAASIIGTGSTNTDSKGFYSVVRDCLIYYVVAELTDTITHQYWNKGVLKKTNEGSENVSMSELIDLKNKSFDPLFN